MYVYTPPPQLAPYPHAHYWKNVGLIQPRELEIPLRPLHVEQPLGRLCGDHPRRLVPAAVHEAAEENGDPFNGDIVGREGGGVLAEIGEGNVGV